MTATQPDVRSLFASQFQAIRMKDLEWFGSWPSMPRTSCISTSSLLCEYAGTAALRGRFAQWFDGYRGAIAMDMRDLNILTSGDIAVAHWLSRASGTLKNGREIRSWVRATSCCQRSRDRWLLAHEHISLPADVKTGTAVMDLVP